MSRARTPIRGRVYWILCLLRALSCAPSAFAVWDYFVSAHNCIEYSRSVSACAQRTILPAIWCLVSGYLTWLGLDGMIIRWLHTYSQPAAIFRVITCVLLNYAAIEALVRFRNHRSSTNLFDLQIWILISVILTVLYILQMFITSNLDDKRRTLNLLHIAVYAVIPIGVASFATMLFLIRCLMLAQLSTANPLLSVVE